MEEAGSHGRQSPAVGITAEGRDFGEEGHPRCPGCLPLMEDGHPWVEQAGLHLALLPLESLKEEPGRRKEGSAKWAGRGRPGAAEGTRLFWPSASSTGEAGCFPTSQGWALNWVQGGG